MASKENRPLRTSVYIDGYNLYYGRLRGTEFKWLDVVKLFQQILEQRDQNEQLAKLTVFTAPALAKFASHGDESPKAQADYHRALKTIYGDLFDCVYGKHSFSRDGSWLPTFLEGAQYDRNKKSHVWKLEEKKTDVNLAISMYRDCSKGICDRVILVSNDSDAEPALAAIKEDFPAVMRGVVIPVVPPTSKQMDRRVSSSLTKNADWTIRYVADHQLASAQLPEIVPTKKKVIRKPSHW